MKVSRPIQLALEIGSRVRLTELGRLRCPRFPNQPGIVVGYSRFNSAVQVRFEGRKSSVVLHADYVELAVTTDRLAELGLKSQE